MAKGRRSRRVRHQPTRRAEAPEAQPQSQPAEAQPPETPAAGVPPEPGDVADRIEALRGEVRQARAEAERRGQPTRPPERRPERRPEPPAEPPAEPSAELAPEPPAELAPEPSAGQPAEPPARPSAGGRTSHRDPVSPFTNPPIRGTGPIGDRPTLEPPYPRPGGGRRRRVYAAAGLSVLVIAGVVAGLLASSSGGSHAPKSPIATYLAGHVAAGTPLAVIGSSRYALPTSYPTVTVTASDLGSATSLRYVVAPDPISSAGPAVAAFVQGHATLVAADRGRASLWAVGPVTASPTTATPATTVPAPGVPVTTAPVTQAPTTVPATTSPSTAPATTVAPTTGAPATTAPPAASTPTSVPPGTGPTRPGTGTTPTPSTTTVLAGQSFWSIATEVLQQHLGVTPTTAQVSRYWASLVAANADRLPLPGHPDLIYPGTTLFLPAV